MDFVFVLLLSLSDLFVPNVTQ